MSAWFRFCICSFEGTMNEYSSLAQSVEHAAVNRSVVGSSPTGGVFGNMKSDIKFNFLPGSMVKRLRHRPFTAVTGVQIPLESYNIIDLEQYMPTWLNGRAADL